MTGPTGDGKIHWHPFTHPHRRPPGSSPTGIHIKLSFALKHPSDWRSSYLQPTIPPRGEGAQEQVPSTTVLGEHNTPKTILPPPPICLTLLSRPAPVVISTWRRPNLIWPSTFERLPALKRRRPRENTSDPVSSTHGTTDRLCPFGRE